MHKCRKHELGREEKEKKKEGGSCVELGFSGWNNKQGFSGVGGRTPNKALSRWLVGPEQTSTMCMCLWASAVRHYKHPSHHKFSTPTGAARDWDHHRHLGTMIRLSSYEMYSVFDLASVPSLLRFRSFCDFLAPVTKSRRLARYVLFLYYFHFFTTVCASCAPFL